MSNPKWIKRIKDFEIIDFISQEQRFTFIHDFSVNELRSQRRKSQEKGEEEEEEKDVNQSET